MKKIRNLKSMQLWGGCDVKAKGRLLEGTKGAGKGESEGWRGR